MANDFNTITFTGRLGADPELRYTEGGSAVCTLRVANGQYDKQAENNELTTWYRVTVFGKRAETANQYLTKGSRVLISGPHRIRPFVDKDGNERESNEVIGNEVTFLDTKADREQSQAPAQPARQSSQSRTSRTMPVARNVPQQIDNDEDLPF